MGSIAVLGGQNFKFKRVKDVIKKLKTTKQLGKGRYRFRTSCWPLCTD